MTTTAPKTEERPITEEGDFLQIKSIDHVHFYVGNAKHAMYYWWKGFGFTPVAYSGLETGNRDYASYVLQSGQIRFVLSAPYSPSSPLAAHHMLHGDGVKVIALEVEDVEQAWKATTPWRQVRLGAARREGRARPLPHRRHLHLRGDPARVRRPLGLQRDVCPHLQGDQDKTAESTGLAAIDHMVGNVQLGQDEPLGQFLPPGDGLPPAAALRRQGHLHRILALMSKVMSNGNGRVKFPINEPAEGKRKSQIEEYLDYYLTPGVQHVAMSTGDILKTVEDLRSRGIEFLRVPDTYYEILPERVGSIKEDLKAIHELGILVDRDDEGYLLQIFSKPIQDRPTMFVEIIQRHGARGFGKGNFKALFESIELEQERRGNL
jgi:4-hydroxyphenylpyruvate dioxygenase